MFIGEFTKGLLRDLDLELSSKPEDTQNSLKVALIRLKMLGEQDDIIDYVENFCWRVGGAETYIAGASFTTKLAIDKMFIAKAVVSLSLSIEKTIETWQHRKICLENVGVKIPTWYAVHKGVIYQDFIEHDLTEILNNALPCQINRLIAKLAMTARCIDELGFEPINLLSDLRSDGAEIYVVDLGFDLGEPYVTSSQKAKELILNKLQNNYKDDFLHYYYSGIICL